MGHVALSTLPPPPTGYSDFRSGSLQSGSRKRNGVTDVRKGAESVATAIASDPVVRPKSAGIAREPEPVVSDRDRLSAEPGLTTLPPPPASSSAAPDRPADLVAETVDAASKTGDRILGKIFGRIPETETNIRKRIDERLAELPTEIERRLTTPPRRRAPEPAASPGGRGGFFSPVLRVPSRARHSAGGRPSARVRHLQSGLDGQTPVECLTQPKNPLPSHMS